MTGRMLFQRLANLGVTVRSDGDQLRLRPAKRIPADCLEQCRLHKAELLALIPPGWPADVPIPPWWFELAGAFPPGFLREARRTDCRGCGFQVAVLWNAPQYGPTWSCPRCGLTSSTTTTS